MARTEEMVVMAKMASLDEEVDEGYQEEDSLAEGMMTMRMTVATAKRRNTNAVLPRMVDMLPTIKAELKVDQIPKWNGDKLKAIDYFHNCLNLAGRGGWLPEAVGYWLWMGFEENSEIHRWWIVLPKLVQDQMCSHVTAFLGEIKTNYLGEKWEREMQAEFQVQAFRQRVMNRKKPTDFLSRRAIWSRMLTTVEEGGIVEVEQILKAAPIPWLSNPTG
ncbi:hypothetical protein BDZ89DRAFT_1147478 [Hymenopellis radicata]|nr:hypothetical protein BDZ89DRAFT_1147478 [Hymenopellis radicata]